ncbi:MULTISPECIES: hypothetical protein [Cyanophyceae]|uniref:Uncharacterized protein n=1 Tax=Stenomitos frigidus AS-A4 TaxID=2933935 RepID=A0ABV0KF05_9CYAN|nr:MULTISPECIES: hypothetical protein [Cyanophyceae]
MSSLKAMPRDSQRLEPESLDQFFPLAQQRVYVAMLMGRGGLTRRRAEYFVRLWAYLLLKQQQQLGLQLSQPLSQLRSTEGLIACTHREAADLFYSNQERGSDRAAGMMIDRFVALGLLEKQFDGQTLCLQIRSLPELETPIQAEIAVTLIADAFNPRTDTIPIANLIARTYAELMKDVAKASHKIAQALRSWARQYPKGLRVLRRSDNLNPIGISVLYPVTSESEVYFFQPPSKSFYLSSDVEVDPFKMAAAGDEHCTSVYIRSWVIDTPYLQSKNISLLLEDSRNTLVEMQQDFPNLCDIYSLILHPLYEDLRLALGFQKTFQDTQRSYHWVYLALDRFLELDIEQALNKMKQGLTK